MTKRKFHEINRTGKLHIITKYSNEVEGNGSSALWDDGANPMQRVADTFERAKDIVRESINGVILQ